MFGLAQRTQGATIQVFITGYTLRGYTATGTYVHPGTCAVDPRIFPLGSYMTIAGIGTCHAEDTGGAVIGYHIDVWEPTDSEAFAITGWRSVTLGSESSSSVGITAPLQNAALANTPVPSSTALSLPQAANALLHSVAVHVAQRAGVAQQPLSLLPQERSSTMPVPLYVQRVNSVSGSLGE